MLGPRAITLEPRQVPLGGVRAMDVARTLPARDLPTVGAWCFLDRFGPGPVIMHLDPHPHIGLQTVTWPLEGVVRHRDSVGSDVLVERGQLNLMTAGRGISHSEYSLGEEPVTLEALQLWIALPESACQGPGGFEQHTDLPTLTLPADDGESAEVTVVVGEYEGVHSPATVHSPLVGAEVQFPAGSRVSLPLHFTWEYAVMLVEGDVRVAAHEVARGDLLFLGDNRDRVEIMSEDGAFLFLLGGEPFTEDLVMWWNFAARTHEEIVQAREDWESGSGRFGHVINHGDERVPAPPIPPVRLKPRRRKLNASTALH